MEPAQQGCRAAPRPPRLHWRGGLLHYLEQRGTMNPASIYVAASVVGAGLLVGTVLGRFVLKKLAVGLGITAGIAILLLDGNSPL